MKPLHLKLLDVFLKHSPGKYMNLNIYFNAMIILIFFILDNISSVKTNIRVQVNNIFFFSP